MGYICVFHRGTGPTNIEVVFFSYSPEVELGGVVIFQYTLICVGWDVIGNLQ